MIRITFTPDDIDQLRRERFSHSHPRVRIKLEALFLKSQGLSHQEIGKMVGITQNTLREYFKQYKSGGIEELKTLHFRKPMSPLEKYRDIIEEDFTKKPPATLKEASARIQELTGIKRGSKQIGRFLKKQDLDV